jgi:hypothetical protein
MLHGEKPDQIGEHNAIDRVTQTTVDLSPLTHTIVITIALVQFVYHLCRKSCAGDELTSR